MERREGREFEGGGTVRRSLMTSCKVGVQVTKRKGEEERGPSTHFPGS